MVDERKNKDYSVKEYPRYNNNPNLKAKGVQMPLTKKQVEEYIKCKKDYLYFIRNYIQITNLDGGVVPFNLYDYQEEMLNLIHDNRFFIAKIPRQSGKCFCKEMKIKLRNKKSKQIIEIKIGEFYESIQKEMQLVSK